MFFPALAAMLVAASAPAEIVIDVGKINVGALPAVKRAERELPTAAMVGQVSTMLAEGKCALKGQRPARFDIDVHYAVLLDPDGTAQRVVVGELGCPALETYAGALVLEFARLGDFKATGQKNAKWFGGILNFNLQ